MEVHKMFKKIGLLFLFLLHLQAFAENTNEKKIQVHSIVLANSEQHWEGMLANEPIHIEGVQLPGSLKRQAKFKSDLEKRFLNRDLGISALEELQSAIIIYYKREGSPLVEVVIPPQDVTEGVLKIIVHESSVGKVKIVGNDWSSAKFTRKIIGLKQGERINTNDLLVDLSFLNKNPFKRTDILFSAGEEKGTTDIEVITNEKRPYRVYAGVDNRGNEAIGNYRQYEGFNCGRFLGMDHIFSYQLTTSIPFGRMYAHAAYYEIPLPMRMSLSFYGGYSHIRTKMFNHYFRNSGENVQFSTRYHLPLFAALQGSNDFSLGFDYKRSNNNVLFSEAPIFAKMATLSQLVMAYEYKDLFDRGWGAFDVQFYLSPFRMFSNQNKSDYQLLSPKAIPHYFYLTLGWENTWSLPHCMGIHIRIKGQIANQNLLPSEQLGLGGFDTVRGYREREINGEQGILANLELFSPYFSIFKWRSLCGSSLKRHCGDSAKDALRFLAFLDYGFVQKRHQIKTEKNAQYIVGIGPGLQYLIDPYLNLTMYWGFRLKTTDVSTSLGGRLNFNLVASF